MRTVSTKKSTQPKKTTGERPRGAKAPGRPKLVRGEAVVQRVLDAAMQELAQSGYKGFRIEEVAKIAGVNKTTVYRRWPTKSDLVRDAITAGTAGKVTMPNTGSLRSDLVAFGRIFVERVTSHVGKCIFRMLSAEGSDPEVIDIIKAMRARNEVLPRTLIANAVARGEVAPGTDGIILIQALIGALHHRVFMMSTPVDEAFLTSLVDLLCHGALRRPERG